MTAAISLKELKVTRGKKLVLDGISMEIPSGSITGLLGPSGSGKTTLLRAIVGVQKNVEGQIEALGQHGGSPILRHSIAYATQDSSVFKDLSVRDNLTYAARILGVEKDKVIEAIERVGLTPFAKQKVSSLSGGQRSRVSLAIALVGDPQVLVLDEPTVGLDPVLRLELWELFRSIADGGKTILVSSHVMDEASRCDQLVLMRAGKVLAFDTLENLLEQADAATAEEAFIHFVERDTK